MFNLKLPHMLCAECKAKVARDAYYCKSCGEVIGDAVAPGRKIEDRRFTSKFKYALARHLIRNVAIAVLLILFAASGIGLGLNYLHAVKDNGSSETYQLIVENPQNPMTCAGSICHILIDIKNKTNVSQTIYGIPDLVTATGFTYGPANPNLMGNGMNYCQQKISLTLTPHQVVKFLGICSQDIPVGTKMVLAQLKDSRGKLVVSGPFRTTVS